MANSKVGMILRSKRIELGWTQEEAASRIEVDTRQYQRYEYGVHDLANCPMRIGLRVCAVFDLDPFEVIIGNKK